MAGGSSTAPTCFSVSPLYSSERWLKSHCRVDYGYQKQGFDRKVLLYYGPLQPYLSWWGISWSTFFLVISGLRTWFEWNASAFVTFCELSFPSARRLAKPIPSTRQTSISPSSLPYTSATSSSRRPGSVAWTRWTSSPISQHLRRRKFQKSRPRMSGRRLLPSFSKRSSL